MLYPVGNGHGGLTTGSPDRRHQRVLILVATEFFRNAEPEHVGGEAVDLLDTERSSPSRWRFRPPNPLTFRFRVEPPG